MDGSTIEAALLAYAGRLATRSGAALEIMRTRLRQSLAVAQLEGFVPTDQDLAALDLFATGHINFREYRGLCLRIARSMDSRLNPESG